MVMITCDKGKWEWENPGGEVLREKNRLEFKAGSRPAPHWKALLKSRVASKIGKRTALNGRPPGIAA
jgi:hypothetical protein